MRPWPKLITIDGPPGVGKTTLARWIVARYGFEYTYVGPPREGVNAFNHYASNLFNTLLHIFDAPGVVIDTFALSDVVMRINGGAERLSSMVKGFGGAQVLCQAGDWLSGADTGVFVYDRTAPDAGAALEAYLESVAIGDTL